MGKRIVKIWEEHSVVGAIILIICVVAGCLAIAFGLLCLKSWLVMLLWNWVAVNLFGAPALGFWIAFGLCLLCDLLFKSKATMNKKSED